MKSVIWTIKNICDVIVGRQNNEFDANIAASGNRGDGKSTILGKIFWRLNGFNPWKHIVYNRDDIIDLLVKQTFLYCWDDEAINSGYKRHFYEKAQQELIKILTAYRDNFNVYGTAIPNFFSLDKDLRDLYFLHLQVIERGVAIIHMPLQGKLYSQDRWDVKYNAKVEESWSKKMQQNPDFRPPYHKLTTFRGYLYFNDLADKQKNLYKEIKRVKRQQSFKTEKDKKEPTFIEKVYAMLVSKKLSKTLLQQLCIFEGKKYSHVMGRLNVLLKDDGIADTVSMFMQRDEKAIHNNAYAQINSIIPDIQS